MARPKKQLADAEAAKCATWKPIPTMIKAYKQSSCWNGTA